MNLEASAAVYAVLNFGAALLTIVLSVYIIRKQGFVNARSFIVLMSATMLHTVTNGILIVSQSTEVARFLENFRWFSLAAIPPLLLVFILDYTGRDQWLTPQWIAVYFAIPLVTQLVVWTNSWHGLMIQDGYDDFLRVGPYLLMGERVFGVWFWVYSIWGYLLTLFALVILLIDAITTPRPEWKQFIWLFVGFFIPIVFSVVDTFRLIEPTWFKLLPFGFVLMGVAFFIAIIRGQFINILPVARGFLIETLQDAVFMLDRNHQVADINSAAGLFIGKSKREVIGKPASEVLQHWPRLATTFQEQEEISTVAQIIKDKTGRSYDTHISPLRGRRKKISGWVIVLHDITQLKEAEVRASQLAVVIEQAQETIVITNLDGNITYANPYFETTTGFSVDEALGQNPRILQSGQQDKPFYEKLWGNITTGKAWGGNFINKRKDGSLYYESATIFPIKNEDGKITSYAAVKRDITPQVQAEQALQESEQQYRLLADNVFDVIWTTDLEGRFTYVSPSVEQLRGYTPEEVLQQSINEALTPESLEIALQAFHVMLSAIQNGEKYTETQIHELEQPCKDRSTVWTEVISTVMYDRDETPLGILGVTREITERRKAEAEMRLYARQQTLLNKITQAAIKQTDFQDMLQTLADQMSELLDADSCYITLWDEETQIAIPAAAYGPLRKTYQTSGQPEPDEITLTESVLKHGEILIIHDVFNSPYVSARIASQFPTRSGIALPLIANDKKLGAALIGFNYQRQYSQTEIDISKQAAQQIALAILKAQLLDEAKQRATEAETLRYASAAVVTTLEQDQAIERILEELNRVVPYDSASVLMVKGIDMEIVGARGFENLDQILHLRFAVTEETPNKVVFETHKPYVLEDAQIEYAVFRKALHNHIHGWMGIPLLIRERLIGMLALDSQQPGRFNQDHARLASAFADQVAIALENARLFEETRRLAITDSLTDLFNRRHFMDLARREFERAVRYKIPLSIIMLDIDHFKNINDTYGHLTGDQVLQTTAFICRRNLRSIDFIGRYGGEEFVILLPETPLVRPTDKNIETKDLKPLPAQIVAERLRKTIEQETFEIGENSITTTISLGVAELNPSDNNIESIIDNADQALLRAKNQGRNQVVI